MYSPIPEIAPVKVFDAPVKMLGSWPSPDHEWLEFVASGMDPPNDLWVASAAHPGVPLRVSRSAFVEPFTSDASYALFLEYDHSIVCSADRGDLTAATVGGVSSVVANGVADPVPPVTATKVVFADDCGPDTSGWDLHFVDVARSDPAVTAARHVDRWLVDVRTSTLLYTTHAPGIDAGLYAVRVP